MSNNDRELLLRIEAKLDAVLSILAQPRPRVFGPPRLVSGRWYPRDGDTYGTVAPQPAVETSPNPPVLPENEMVTPNANNTAGDLRSTDER